MRVHLLTLGIIVLSGCLGSLPQHGDPEVMEFQAKYKILGRGELDVSLDGPVMVADWTLAVRPAYRLRIHVDLPSFYDPGERGYPAHLRDLTFFLDDQFRIVRIDYPCASFSAGECQSSILTWRAAGLLPPLGMLWPVATQDWASMEVTAGGATWDLPLEIQGSRGARSVIVDGEAMPNNLHFADLQGLLEYKSGQPVPSRLNVTTTLWSLTSFEGFLVDFTSGAKMPAIARWPTRAFEPTPIENPPLLFASAGKPFWNRTFSPQEAFEVLRHESETARDYLERGGCLMRISIVYDIQYGGYATPLHDVEDEFYDQIVDQINIEVTDPNGLARRFVVRHFGGSFFDEPHFEYRGESETDFALQCEHRAAAKSPLTYDRFAEEVASLPLTDTRLNSYRIDWYDHNAGWDTALGYQRYVATVEADETGTSGPAEGAKVSTPYYVIMRAAPGWWEEVWLAKEAAAAIDTATSGMDGFAPARKN